MSQLVIFVEEPSMAIVIETLSKRLRSDKLPLIIENNGKTELRDSIKAKTKQWQRDDRFLILHDKDSHPDCIELKQQLFSLVHPPRVDKTKIRIVMNELEAWYLSDLSALVNAGLLKAADGEKLRRKRKFRNVETLNNAKQEFHKLVKRKGQRALARLIAPHLDPDRSCSSSFKLVCKEILLP